MSNLLPIAIVEDDTEIRESIRDALECEGYEVQTFKNGQEAIQGLAEASPSLILLDLMMPVMDGWKFLEEKKRLGPTLSEIPVFIVSAVADPSKVKEAGAKGYIRKPLDLDVLLKLVEGYCKLG